MGKINEIGNRYGNLIVIKEATKTKNRSIMWECQCDCGNIAILRGTDLRNGKKISCAECSKKRTAKKLTKDITGQRFGRLTVKKYAGQNLTKHNGAMWECQCDCGNIINIARSYLISGQSIECSDCAKQHKIEKLIEYNHNRREDLTGKQFGDLTVLYLTDKKDKHGDRYWACKCSCGNIVEVLRGNLKSGTQSCGHRKSNGEEKINQILKENNLQYIKEKRFSSCKDQKELPFDFYVNNQYLIEYDGIQHFSYKNKGGWNDKEHFEITKKHDEIKNQWCKENHIPLIRIPYTHYNDICLEDLLLETSKFII